MRGRCSLGQDYRSAPPAPVSLARRSVNYKHALRNAILVIVATLGGLYSVSSAGRKSVEYVTLARLTPLFCRASTPRRLRAYGGSLTILGALMTVTCFLTSRPHHRLRISPLMADRAGRPERRCLSPQGNGQPREPRLPETVSRKHPQLAFTLALYPLLSGGVHPVAPYPERLSTPVPSSLPTGCILNEAARQPVFST